MAEKRRRKSQERKDEREAAINKAGREAAMGYTEYGPVLCGQAPEDPLTICYSILLDITPYYSIFTAITRGCHLDKSKRNHSMAFDVSCPALPTNLCGSFVS